MKFKTCKICSPYLLDQKGVFYKNKVLVVAEPPIYHPFHEEACEPIAEIDGQYLYSINDCAVEEDCFLHNKNAVIIETNYMFGLVNVLSGEVLLEPLYRNMWDVEEKMMKGDF
ncbi:hypothetical protein V6615_11325 [Oscillospiraceae bacterium PP1C4]